MEAQFATQKAAQKQINGKKECVENAQKIPPTGFVGGNEVNAFQ